MSQLAADLVMAALATDGTVFTASFKFTEGAQTSTRAEVASISSDGVFQWRRDLGGGDSSGTSWSRREIGCIVTDQFGVHAFSAGGSPVYAVPDQAEKQPSAGGLCPSPVAVSSDGSQNFLVSRRDGPEKCSAALATVDASGRAIASSVVQEWQWDRCEPWNAHLAWVSAVPSGGAYTAWQHLATSPAMIGGVLQRPREYIFRTKHSSWCRKPALQHHVSSGTPTINTAGSISLRSWTPQAQHTLAGRIGMDVIG